MQTRLGLEEDALALTSTNDWSDVSLNTPDEAVRYILFQRTYFRLPVAALYRHVFSRLPFPVPLFNLAVAVESRFGAERVKRLYASDMVAEYETIRSSLPPRCSTMLDIGCGVAGIDVFLDRHYADQAPAFYLLDKSQVERNVYYLFKPKAAFYNSLEIARTVLTSNGIPPERVHLLTATERNEIGVERPIDLVISLISWGFHYPVEIYCKRVREVLSDDGVVILDVRKGTDGIDVLRQTFRSVDVIVDAPKYDRIVAKK